jgi:hypothetical protein
MAKGIIPVRNDISPYSMRIALGAVVYVLTFRYNARMDRWLLDVADANLNILVSGQPILGGLGVAGDLGGCIPGWPAGLLFTLDNTGAGRDAQENTFGGDVPLYYWEP